MRIEDLVDLKIRPIRICVDHAHLIPEGFREVYALIPMRNCNLFPKNTVWEGSYIPMAVYEDHVAIIIPHGEVERWMKLVDEVSRILKTEVKIYLD